jgi:hypothetical protein
MTFYICHAGLHGYLSQYTSFCLTYQEAVDNLAEVHELGRDRKRELKRNGFLELNLRRDGNEYCEIVELSHKEAMELGWIDAEGNVKEN